MTKLAAATATTVGGNRRAARVTFHTLDGSSGSATSALPSGLADAAVAWASRHLPDLEGREVDDLFEALGTVEADWNDRAAAEDHDQASARGAVALTIDALWDLWARRRRLPLWKLIVELPPAQLVHSLDLRAVDDVLTAELATSLLGTRVRGRAAREADLLREGYPVVPAVVLDGEDAIARIGTLARTGWPVIRVELAPGIPTARTTDALLAVRRAAGPDGRLVVGPRHPWSPTAAATAATVFERLGRGVVDELAEPIDGGDAVALAALAGRADGGSGGRIDLAAGDRLTDLVAVKQLLATHAVDVCRLDPGRLGISATLVALLLAARLHTPVCLCIGRPAPDPATGRPVHPARALHLAAVDQIAIGANLDRRWVDLGTDTEPLGTTSPGRPGRRPLPTRPGVDPDDGRTPPSDAAHR